MAELLKTIQLSHEIISIGSVPIPTAPTHSVDIREEEDKHQPAIDEAYNHGFQQGFSEGLAEAHRELGEQRQALASLLQSIPEAISNNRLQMTGDIADICLAIIQRLFIHQQHDKTALTNQINQILTQLNHQDNLEIALHPNDITQIKHGELNLELKQCKNLRIIPDETLQLGGCIIRSEHGVFDASIERQIDSLKQVLLQLKKG